MNDLPFGKHFH